MTDPTLREELLMLDAQLRQFLEARTRHSWAERRDYFFRLGARLRELADMAPAGPAADAGADRRAA